jgi:hypothetical protein
VFSHIQSHINQVHWQPTKFKLRSILVIPDSRHSRLSSFPTLVIPDSRHSRLSSFPTLVIPDSRHSRLSSFPRKRESRLSAELDSRFRGNDANDCEVFAFGSLAVAEVKKSNDRLESVRPWTREDYRGGSNDASKCWFNDTYTPQVPAWKSLEKERRSGPGVRMPSSLQNPARGVRR